MTQADTKATYQFRTHQERAAYQALVNDGERGLKAIEPRWAIDLLNKWCDAGIARIVQKSNLIPSPSRPGVMIRDFTETWKGYRKYINLPVGR